MGFHRRLRTRSGHVLAFTTLIATTTAALAVGIAPAVAAPAALDGNGYPAPYLDDEAPDGAVSADLSTPAGRMVWDLTDGHHERVLAELPDSFVETMGYRPGVEDGYPVDADGDCSSPIPMPDRFDRLCRTHDFGYDVLRFAEQQGHPLGGWARRRLDGQLIDRMHASCSSPLCDLAAVAAAGGLRLNTWRQYDGPPAPNESTVRIVSTAVERGWATLTVDLPKAVR
ncbi:hypothetical protein AAFP35_19745 [Gordonia sp. CPCC 206044]|uniref:hypothetical protein n=1 Tax=Gordonia sp. CPCC 206044 TaxID=3140793 RepID=UPI003AF35101